MRTAPRALRTLRTAATLLLPLALAIPAAGAVQAAAPGTAPGSARSTVPADVENACGPVPAGSAA
ncbi:hypothetical protein VSR01_09790 [Actinacidiphila sp. DG2A-62]|uniref:hypothetical protein n=1 Tax=Actinacidiphila sp. DG2A-62 TaxID=3108821 RepID=UPI002DBA42EB|nr:hypothetical protein [Actinacidiphila sp. DG2A-62]MEC3993816.1 hypothetical protein [Actinacidiphila sp. DG2A-62]